MKTNQSRAGVETRGWVDRIAEVARSAGAAGLAVLVLLACGEDGQITGPQMAATEAEAVCVPARDTTCPPRHKVPPPPPSDTTSPPPDTTSPPPDTTSPPPDTTSPPPGEPSCEATSPGRCWYVAANASGGGNGTFADPFRVPQDAVERAGPGDFIYLRGGAEFTHDHAYEDPVHGSFIAHIMDRDADAGAPGAPITLKSYPGEQAVIRGKLVVDGHLRIKVGLSHWRVEGLRIHHGTIAVGHTGTGLDVEDVWIVGNHLSDVVASWGNFGIIQVTGQPTQGGAVDHSLDPTDIHILNNVARTLWGQQANGSVVPWNLDADIEHHACFAALKWNANVEVRGNDFGECAAGIYFKWESPGALYLADNSFGPVHVFGRSRALDVQCADLDVAVLSPLTFPLGEVCH